MHRCQTQDLRPLVIPQLLSHHAIQPRPNRLASLIYEHARIVIEIHHAAVGSLGFLRGAHHHCVSDVASSDFVCGGDGDGGAFGAEVALFLHDDDYAVAWRGRLEGVVVVRLVDGWMGG